MSALPGSGAARNWWWSPMGLVLQLALLSSAVAWWMIAFPVATFSNVAKHAGHFGPLYVHMLGGTTMLFLGGINLWIGATRRQFRFHRLVGRSYLVGGAIGAGAAIWMTLGPWHKSDASVVFTNTSVSLATLALAWLGCASMGWRAARNRRFDVHRDWMIRSYVLVWSFVFCRIASRVTHLGDLGGGEAFIWLSWVAPFLLCEFALQWRAGAARVDPRA